MNRAQPTGFAWRWTASWWGHGWRLSHLLLSILGFTGLILALSLRVIDPFGLMTTGQARGFDQIQAMIPAVVPSPSPSVTIAIDDASLQRIGRWPWPRPVLGQLVRAAVEAGASLVVLDVLLPEPESDATDAELARLLTGLPVVLAVSVGNAPKPLPADRFQIMDAGTPSTRPLPLPMVPGYLPPIPALRDHAIAMAHLGEPGSDRLRRLPLGFTDTSGTRFMPGLALAALTQLTGETPTLVRAGADADPSGQAALIGALVGQKRISTDAEGYIRPHFRPPPPMISAHQLLLGPRPVLTGRVAFIGATADGLQDRHSTVITADFPGVEIHRQAFDALWFGTHLQRPDWATGLETMLMIGAALLLLWRTQREGSRALLWLLVMLIAAMGLPLLMLAEAGWLFDPFTPTLTLFATGSGVIIGRSLRDRSARQQIRLAFEKYLDHRLVQRLMDDPTQVRLGGERREISVLFCDIRDFTLLSQQHPPEVVVPLLNQLHGALVKAAKAEGGMIDKFIGDCVMVLFGAPLSQPDHAERALRAALAMAQVPNRLFAEGRLPHAMGVSIGVESGVAMVGNMGSADLFDYTAIGPAVNLAARLQGAAESRPILIGPTMAAQLKGKVPLRPLPPMRLKGIDTEITAWEPTDAH